MDLYRDGFDSLVEQRARKNHTVEDVLAHTLPYVLAAKESAPLFAWVQYFVQTEP